MHDQVYSYCLNSQYVLDQVSDDKAVYRAARPVCRLTPEQAIQLPLHSFYQEAVGALGLVSKVSHAYINRYDIATPCNAHVDGVNPVLTLLYYPNVDWHHDWGGETVFFDSDKDIAFSAAFKPNRAILFDERLMHSARSPSILAKAARFSVTYKGKL